MANPEADYTVELVVANASAKVQVVGDQVLVVTPEDEGKVVVVGPDGVLELDAVAGDGVTDHGDLTGLNDADHPIAAVVGLQAALDAKLAKGGGTMTGALVLAGDAAAALQPTPLQQVQALIAAVVNGAPGTLDALNELAAAIGNDANFSASMATALGNKQAAHANLTAFAGLALVANKLAYANGAGTLTLADFTAAGRALLDDADASAQLTTLGLSAYFKTLVAGADAATVLALLGGAPTAQLINPQVAAYTLVAADAGKLVTLNTAGAIALTVPQDSDAAIAVGTYVDLLVLGAGQVTVTAGAGATLRVSGLTAKSRAQYARFGVQKVSANTWSLFGDLAAS